MLKNTKETKETKDTRIHLVKELENLPCKDHSAVQEIILEAKAGEYHDYKNTKYACGKVAVTAKLRKAATLLQNPVLLELAKRVEEGEFDEVADSEDITALERSMRELTEKRLKHSRR